MTCQITTNNSQNRHLTKQLFFFIFYDVLSTIIINLISIFKVQLLTLISNPTPFTRSLSEVMIKKIKKKEEIIKKIGKTTTAQESASEKFSAQPRTPLGVSGLGQELFVLTDTFKDIPFNKNINTNQM